MKTPAILLPFRAAAVTAIVTSAIALHVAFPAATARADEADYAKKLAELEAQLKSQQAQIQKQADELSKLKSGDRGSWLQKREKEDYQALIDDVLRDAEKRRALQGEGVVAGVRNGEFVIGDGTGNNELRVNTRVMIRYAAAIESGGSGGPDGDETTTGFEVRRTQVNLEGNVVDPRLGYRARLTMGRNSSNTSADYVLLSYKLTDNFTVIGGQLRAPFSREENMSSFAGLAPERSLVNEVTTAGFVQGVGIDVMVGDALRGRAMVHDGVQSGEGGARGFENDDSDGAVTARVDIKLMGEWDQWKEYANYVRPNNAFIGGAIHAEQGESNDAASAIDNRLGATVDGSLQVEGVSVFAAYTIWNINRRSVKTQTIQGVVAQVAVQIIPELLEAYFRGEYLDIGSGATGGFTGEDVYIASVGVNVFLQGRSTKLIIDVGYAPNSIPAPAALGIGAGTLGGVGWQQDSAGADGQVLVRVQLNIDL